MNNYQKQKQKAREEAIKYSLSFNTKNYSYKELVDFTCYFYTKGKRYGLLKEFRENGII